MVAAKHGTFYGQAMTAGHLYAVAGNGKFGYAPSGVPATTAKLGGVQDVTVDGAGNLVIADWGHNLQDLSRWARVQVVAAKTGTFYGQAMTVGDHLHGGRIGPAARSANGHPASQAAIGEYSRPDRRWARRETSWWPALRLTASGTGRRARSWPVYGRR